MSTHGTAIIIDTDDAESMTRLLHSVIARAEPDHASSTVWAPLQPLGPTTVRGGIYLPGVQIDEEATEILSQLTSGRVAVADDFDEYGAIFSSWNVDQHAPHLVYRAVICPEGDDSLREDSELPELTGEFAANQLAALWRVDPATVRAADAQRDSLTDELEVVGGPFPWWSALGLAWPAG